MADRVANAESSIPPRRRRWRYIVGLLCLIVLLVGVAYLYRVVSAAAALSGAIAETDRLDPHWRFEELEAGRSVVPEGENSADIVTAAKQLMPKDWPYWEFWTAPQGGKDPPDAPFRKSLSNSFSDLEPQRELNGEQISALRMEMARAAQAVHEARKLVDLTQGRYPAMYSADSILTPAARESDARAITQLLSFDAILRAQDNDPDGALASCQAALNAARSIGDQPDLVAVLIRIACRATAVGRVERTLAEGEPSDAALRRFQVLLVKEDSEPLLLNALRGERARADRLAEGLASGRAKLSPLALDERASFAGEDKAALEEKFRVMGWVPGAGNIQRAALLRYSTHAVELAKLPPEKQRAEFSKWDAEGKDQPFLVRLLAPGDLGKLCDADLRTQAYLRCVLVAIAAERYRRAQGRWPDTLDNLRRAADLQDEVVDPFDGRPLRWLRLTDGAEVYSVGPDGEDNGGNITRHYSPLTAGTDIGIRLWNPAQRRQAPAPLPPIPMPIELGP